MATAATAGLRCHRELLLIRANYIHQLQALTNLLSLKLLRFEPLPPSLLTTSDDSLWQLTKTTEISGCRHFSCQQPVWVQFDRFDDSFRRITDKCQIGQEWAFLKRSLQAANPEVTNREILWVCGKIVVSCGQQQFTEWRTGGN